MIYSLIKQERVMKKVISFLLVSNSLIFSNSIFAESQTIWTLNTSVKRALEVSPEMKTADAEIGKQRGMLKQAIVWPNPSISIKADNALGLETTTGDYNISEFSVSQDLVFGRIEPQRRQAQASVARAQAHRRHQQLLLEYNVAKRFHKLQFTKSNFSVAKKRLQQAKQYQNSANNTNNQDHLIRYLTPLETMRLNIVLQVARQAMQSAEGEYNEALASFKALLNLPINSKIALKPLSPVPTQDKLLKLKNNLKNHPMIEANKKTITSSLAAVTVAKSNRYSPPSLTLFRTDEFIGNRRQDSTGIIFNVQIPLWNNSDGKISQARFKFHQAQAKLELNQRELNNTLHLSFMHLTHLIKQAEHYRSKLLNPAKKMFKLTRKGFNAGALNILTLIDANNTYYDAQQRYLELLQNAWQELATVRKSAGKFVSSDRPSTKFDEVK